tara:strand:+ start:196 stop:372 length:177 start_codon:yes stop_codon:yes gene_type:complete
MSKQKIIRWICYAVALIGFVIVIVSLFGPADMSAADSKELSNAMDTGKILSPALVASK